MYSKARVAGHALHPMLVAFPIAFYTATVATLSAYAATGEAFWYHVAMVASIAGVVTALIAVIPGAIDLRSLPRESRARAVGTRHAGIHLLATALFAATAAVVARAWSQRAMTGGEYTFDATIPLALSVVAWVAMAIGGSLGWKLVQTHHIGVKPALTLAGRPSPEPEPEPGPQPDDTTGIGEVVATQPHAPAPLRLITSDRDDRHDRGNHREYRGRRPTGRRATRTTATS